jgi:gliding motility-associated-like protein
VYKDTTGFIIKNDFSIDGYKFYVDTVKTAIVKQANNGTFVFRDSTFSYAPDKNFNGRDTVVLTICERNSKCYNDTIFIIVNPIDDTLEVRNETFTVKKGEELSGTFTNITLNDSDVDKDIIYVGITSDSVITGNLGILTISKNGAFSYQSTAGLGQEQFIFDVCSNGICKKDTLTIIVTGIPTGFSPNGDGTNDRYEIVFPPQWGKANIEVYNRWGSLVYAKDDYRDEWDGRSNRGITIGDDLPDGTYFLHIKYTDNPDANEVIYITLLR